MDFKALENACEGEKNTMSKIKELLPVISSISEDVLFFEELKNLGVKVVKFPQRLKSRSKAITIEMIKEIMTDLPRHSSTEYINRNSLNYKYFEEVEKSLDEDYIYIVLSDTGSAASNVIAMFTQEVYNHASIAFDSELKTLVSYNGGEKIHPPGLNFEMIEWFCKKEESSIIIYRMKVSRKQKERMIEKIKEINEDGSAYNLVGLALKKSFKPNIMFCSQFVYSLLKYADPDYFDRQAIKVKPTDLIEDDYNGKLEFFQKINLYHDLQHKN